jgi:hypothetical integral membrane protein (TIGR02206 family)
MSPFQIGSLAFVLLMPALVWAWDRQPHRRALVRLAERTLAAALLLAYLADLFYKWRDGQLDARHALPMQLCDWALLLLVPTLWVRWRAGFDLVYFWGLAGTLQALVTPAVGADLHWFRKLGFFLIHAGIVAGVVHLILTARFRPEWPRSIVRVILASELYLASALTINALTGGNYGFLSAKPSTRTMLDLFSDERWLYAVQLNLVAFAFFAALYAPWAILDLTRRRKETAFARTRASMR